MYTFYTICTYYEGLKRITLIRLSDTVGLVSISRKPSRVRITFIRFKNSSSFPTFESPFFCTFILRRKTFRIRETLFVSYIHTLRDLAARFNLLVLLRGTAFQFQFSGVLIPHFFVTPTLLRLFLSAINMIRQTLLQYFKFVLYEFGCVRHPTVSVLTETKKTQNDVIPTLLRFMSSPPNTFCNICNQFVTPDQCPPVLLMISSRFIRTPTVLP
jgi:hypothetical protein